MAQYSMNAYDADVYIQEFKGLMQYGDQMQSDLRYSPDCLNVEPVAGVLQPSMPISGPRVRFYNSRSGSSFSGEQSAQSVGTLMYLRERVVGGSPLLQSIDGYAGNSFLQGGVRGFASKDPGSDVFLIALGGGIYELSLLGNPKETGEYRIAKVSIKSGDEPTGDGFRTDRWSWCTYETNINDVTRNVIIMSSPLDGVYMYDGVQLSKLATPAKFSWIAQYADRIWGCGVGNTDGDSLYYSRPFDCTDWTANTTNPADGGGQIREPTWDKDRFTALKRFGDGLIAFTKKRAWRISGTDPTNFSLQEQFGNGCLYPDTLVNMGQYMLMLGEDSLVTYDGYQVRPFMKEATFEILKKINRNEYITPTATRVGDRYVLAMSNEAGNNPEGSYAKNFSIGAGGLIGPQGAETRRPEGRYLTVVYNQTDGTITVNSAPQILSFCELMPYALTYSSSKNYFCHVEFDSWEKQTVTSQATRWASPWVTFGRNDIKKGGFDLYFTPEVRPKRVFSDEYWNVQNVTGGRDVDNIREYEETSGSVTIRFSIQTEKKTKVKEYTVQPLSDEDIAAGKKHKMKKLHFGGSGRRFRLIIETDSGNTIPWRLIGGIHIIAETDKD